MNKLIMLLVFVIFSLNWNTESIAKGVYLEPEKFIDQAFDNNPPKLDKLWITKKLKAEINNILGHDPEVIRIRYWDDNSIRAWILEEIGRDKPITVGLITANGKILQLSVLIFRESRGWEVKYPFFTDQFKQVSLTTDNKLDRKIDGISGATLSVNALTRLARLALYLDAQVSNK